MASCGVTAFKLYYSQRCVSRHWCTLHGRYYLVYGKSCRFGGVGDNSFISMLRQHGLNQHCKYHFIPLDSNKLVCERLFVGDFKANIGRYGNYECGNPQRVA